MFIKSEKALQYQRDFGLQCPQIDPPIAEDVRVTIHIYYASRRPDLDESVILDCMQSEKIKNPVTKKQEITRSNVYLNDRQVREKHIYWHLDKDNPRCEVKVELL